MDLVRVENCGTRPRMTYAGGLGAGRGWYKCYFLVTPDELSDHLSAVPLRLVLTKRRVPTEYSHTEQAEYLNQYHRYFDQLLVGAPIAWDGVSSLSVDLTPRLNLLSSRRCPDPRYKVISPTEPIVNLTPFTIAFNGTRLWTDVLGPDETAFGLKMTYPTVVSFDHEGHATLYQTDQFQAFELFTRLQDAIRRATVPCVVESPSRTHKTRIRISKKAKGLVCHRPYLKDHDLKLL